MAEPEPFALPLLSINGETCAHVTVTSAMKVSELRALAEQELGCSGFILSFLHQNEVLTLADEESRLADLRIEQGSEVTVAVQAVHIFF